MHREETQGRSPHVKIKIDGTSVQVEAVYQIRYKMKETGTYICTIPEFNIFYAASDKEAIVKKGDVFMDIFFGHYLDNDSKFSMRKFALNLHRLGFKPTDNPSAMVNIMRNKPDRNTNFKRSNIDVPKGFDMASTFDRTNNFAIHA